MSVRGVVGEGVCVCEGVRMCVYGSRKVRVCAMCLKGGDGVT